MKKNMGYTDRLLRVLLSLFLAALYFADVFTGKFSWLLLVFSATLLITTYMQYCPLYSVFNFHTNRVKVKP